MNKRLPFVLLLLLILPISLPPGSALAHGFGVRYDLPVPLWLYLYGAAGTVALSFLLIAFFVGEDRPGKVQQYPRYPRFNLLRLPLFRALFAGRPTLLLLRLLSVGLFSLTIVTGLLGSQNPAFNFAPTFVWIIWWVGLGFFTAFVGNLWELANPWKIIFEWAEGAARRLGFAQGLGGQDPYPSRWGVLPALLFYFAFVWVEVIYEGSPDPFNIALFALLYSAITWGGMMLYGKEAWLRHAEAFTVFFGVLAKFAPTEVRVAETVACQGCRGACMVATGAAIGAGGEGGCVNCYECFVAAPTQARELNLRPWAAGLMHGKVVAGDRLLFVIFILASVTFDGLAVTSVWEEIAYIAYQSIGWMGSVWYPLFQTLGLLAVPALFLALYYGSSYLIKALGRSTDRLGEVAGAFIYSLVPIALAYQVAHYYTLLLVQGQGIFSLSSDPFGWGWDLFGTAGAQPNVGIVDAAFVWYSQVGLIIAGHVIAVYLAHSVAMRLLGSRKQALRSQYPMLALMILYTVSSLWILSQPVVTENKTLDEGGGRSREWGLSITPPRAAPPIQLGADAGTLIEPGRH